MSSDSESSPAPEEIHEEYNLPDDALVIQFPNLDPNEVLENPELDFENEFKDQPLDEKMTNTLRELLDSYKALAICSFDINTYIVNWRLAHGGVKQKDVFDILDKFYRDYPDASPIPAESINENSMQLMTDKLKLHAQCKGQLDAYASVVKVAKEEWESKHSAEEEEEEEEENSEEDSEEEEASDDQAKRQRLMKAKRNQKRKRQRQKKQQAEQK